MSFTVAHFTITAVIMAVSWSDTISYRKKRKVSQPYARSHPHAHRILYFSIYFTMSRRKPIAASVHLPNVATGGDHFLYTTKYNYVDLNADDNGIWAIYTTAHSSHTNVVKV